MAEPNLKMNLSDVQPEPSLQPRHWFSSLLIRSDHSRFRSFFEDLRTANCSGFRARTNRVKSHQSSSQAWASNAFLRASRGLPRLTREAVRFTPSRSVSRRRKFRGQARIGLASSMRFTWQAFAPSVTRAVARDWNRLEQIGAEELEGIYWVFGCDHFWESSNQNEQLESLDRTLKSRC